MSTITTGKVIIYKPNFNVNPLDTLLDLPVLGAENTLYVIKDTGAIYLWNGSEFIIYDSRPYKVYTALLTQTGTDAPIATVLENTLGGEVVWSYSSVGTYIATLASAFTVNKTIVITPYIRDYTAEPIPSILAERVSVNAIEVYTGTLNNVTGDEFIKFNTGNSILNATFIKIEVYP